MRERILLAAPLIAACAAAFFLIDMLNARVAANSSRFVDLALPLDERIPLVPTFVYAYVLYYPWLLLPLTLRRRSCFYHALAAFSALQLTAAVVFVLMPSQMARPVIVGEGLARDLLRGIYASDEGWNLLPSLHVAHSVLVALLFWNARSPLRHGVVLGTLLISASTVLVKQHYLIDIPAGMVFAVGAYFATRPVHKRVEQRLAENQPEASGLAPQREAA